MKDKEPRIFIKKHETEHGAILAMCDKELIGKILKGGKLLIDLDKYASFYQGDLVSEESARNMVGEGEIYSANIVGERSVSIVVDKKIVEREQVRKVGKVPFVHIYKVDII